MQIAFTGRRSACHSTTTSIVSAQDGNSDPGSNLTNLILVHKQSTFLSALVIISAIFLGLIINCKKTLNAKFVVSQICYMARKSQCLAISMQIRDASKLQRLQLKLYSYNIYLYRKLGNSKWRRFDFLLFLRKRQSSFEH